MNVRTVDTLYVPTKMLNWAGKTTPAWFVMSHALDLALWLTGKMAKSVYAKGIRGKLTGMGMKNEEMKEVARLLKQVLADKEVEKTRKEVAEFTKDYQSIHYSFFEGEKAFNL